MLLKHKTQLTHPESSISNKEKTFLFSFTAPVLIKHKSVKIKSNTYEAQFIGKQLSVRQ